MCEVEQLRAIRALFDKEQLWRESAFPLKPGASIFDNAQPAILLGYAAKTWIQEIKLYLLQALTICSQVMIIPTSGSTLRPGAMASMRCTLKIVYVASVAMDHLLLRALL